jgi:hypothetical protein
MRSMSLHTNSFMHSLAIRSVSTPRFFRCGSIQIQHRRRRASSPSSPFRVPCSVVSRGSVLAAPSRAVQRKSVRARVPHDGNGRYLFFPRPACRRSPGMRLSHRFDIPAYSHDRCLSGFRNWLPSPPSLHVLYWKRAIAVGAARIQSR